jgi:uncharacterized FlaG/YvyC family protein
MDVPSTTSSTSPLSALGVAPQNQERRLLANAVAAINQSGLLPATTLKIHYDVAAQRLTVQYIDNETNEVLDQIPSEEALRMAQELAGSPSAASDRATVNSED